MYAKIHSIDFSPNKIVVTAQMFYNEGEYGYETCWRDVPDYPATDAEPNPPTHKEFFPFRAVQITFGIDVTLAEAKVGIKKKLQAFKQAHNKVEAAQQFIGTEINL